MGVAGAAYATVIAQLFSVVLCIVYLWTKCPILKFSGKDLRWEPRLIKDLLSMGFSMGLMLVVVSIGSVALQKAVNSLGEQIIAAHTTARKIDSIFMMPISTLGTAAATFVGQNVGAGKYDRITKGIKTTLGMTILWGVFSFGVLSVTGN